MRTLGLLDSFSLSRSYLSQHLNTTYGVLYHLYYSCPLDMFHSTPLSFRNMQPKTHTFIQDISAKEEEI